MRNVLKAAALVALLAPPIYYSAPALYRKAAVATSLLGKPWNQRRTIILGSWYRDIREVRKIVGPDEAIAIIPRRPEDRDVAVFAIYHLYPRAVRLFWSFPDWQRNLHEGVDRSRPPADWIITVNQAQTPMIQLMRHDRGRFEVIPLP